MEDMTHNSLQIYINSIGAVSYSSSALKFGRGVAANLTNFRCYGNETHLVNCTPIVSSCGLDNTAGVKCYGDVVSGL